MSDASPSGAHLARAIDAASMASRLLLIARLRLEAFSQSGSAEAEFLQYTGMSEYVISGLQRDLEQLSSDLAIVAEDWANLNAANGAQRNAGR